jgi:serine/threonine protein kinase
MNGIIHRDLKPSKILVSYHQGKPNIKIGGFGSSRCISATDYDWTIEYYTLAYSCLK